MKEIITFVVAFLGVIGLIFLTYYAGRWLSKRMYCSYSGKIHILERTSVSQDKLLAVVKVGSKIMLLGISPQHIDKLCDLDPEDIEDPVQPEKTAQNASGQSFLDNLKKATMEHSFVKPFIPQKKDDDDDSQSSKR